MHSLFKLVEKRERERERHLWELFYNEYKRILYVLTAPSEGPTLNPTVGPTEGPTDITSCNTSNTGLTITGNTVELDITKHDNGNILLHIMNLSFPASNGFFDKDPS